MADVAIPSMILFITSLVVAAGVAGLFATEVGQLTGDIDDLGFDTSNTIRADIEIVSDAGSQMYDIDGDGEVRVYVKNTGTRTLSSDPVDITVLLDGEFQPEGDLTVTVLESSEWAPGDVIRIDVAEPGLAAGTHRLSVGIDGRREVMEFTV